MKKIEFIHRCGAFILIAVFLPVFFMGCSSQGESGETTIGETTAETTISAETTIAESETEGSLAETTSGKEQATDTNGAMQSLETYPETVSAEEAAEDESPYFGVMYATILSVSGTGVGEDISYTFVDKNGDQDSWTFTGLEIGANEVAEEDMITGTEVAILFNGDVINDSENVRCLVILPEGTYSINKVTGIVTDNMMSTFTLQEANGEELHFLKDNCKMDDNALDMDEPKDITVYYTDGGDLGNFPLRIYG